MTRIAKILTGAAATAMLAVTAAPASAQYYDPYRYRRDRGTSVGDIITGVAVAGGIAAAVGAISRSVDSGRYGYRDGYYRGGYGYNQPGYAYNNYGYGLPGYGYGSGYGAQAAINGCSYQAQRYGGGNIRVTDVDQRGGRSFRVRGVIDGNAGYYDRYGGRTGFSCSARDDGRVTDFDIDRYR